ncbi:MAG: hypothetical protein K6G81_10070 [Lachnospiraceae bacterium]|nr:hypothetical protein [Lachnospiraceae bacterium]
MPYISVNDSIELFYEEFGSGSNYILSSQAGFYKKGMQQYLAGIEEVSAEADSFIRNAQKTGKWYARVEE